MPDKLILKKTQFYFSMLHMFSHQNNIEEECVASHSICILESRLDKHRLLPCVQRKKETYKAFTKDIRRDSSVFLLRP